MPNPNRPPYRAEFRAEAVRLARSPGHTFEGVARDLGVARESVRRWAKLADIDAGRAEGLTTEEREELHALRRRVKVLEEERTILVKPRPSSPRRPTGPADRIRVRRAREGQPPRDDNVPPVRCLPERLLGLAEAPAIEASDKRCRAARPDPGGPSGEPRHIRRAPRPRGVPCPWIHEGDWPSVAMG